MEPIRKQPIERGTVGEQTAPGGAPPRKHGDDGMSSVFNSIKAFNKKSLDLGEKLATDKWKK